MENFMKKQLLLTLTIISAVPMIKADNGFGGGFATGALFGGLTAAAITSGNRESKDPAYYDMRDRQAQRAEIRRQIRELEKQLRKAQKRGDKAQVQKLKDQIKELNEDLRSI